MAAPSQAAALRAWGARGDLFALGEAAVVTDADLTAEPLARPGEVVRRPRGDMAAMLAATPKPPKAPGGNTAGAKRSGTPPEPPQPPPPPDRSALDAAERALSQVRERLAHELDALAQERAELDRQEERTRREGKAEVTRLERGRENAERAFREAGGEP